MDRITTVGGSRSTPLKTVESAPTSSTPTLMMIFFPWRKLTPWDD